MKTTNFFKTLFISFAIIFGVHISSNACTGISLTAQDGSKIMARTCEWGSYDLKSQYVIVPRGYKMTAGTPTGANGLPIVAKYGYVGISAIDASVFLEGMNEAGLVSELFFFPQYGKHEAYNPANNSTTILDAQLIPWMLSNFSTVDEMLKGLDQIHVVQYEESPATAHWNVADATGHQVVIEFRDGKLSVSENTIGVITNSPYFDWHLKNLNNYVNIYPGAAKPQEIMPGVNLKAFGAGSGALGLPGDVTPPSRFVRAAFFKSTARQQATGKETVLQAFQILNNFDIPVGVEFAKEEKTPDFISATQWTTACDIKARTFYYKTEWNSTIRCIDLKTIDFAKVAYQVQPLDATREQPIEYIKIG